MVCYLSEIFKTSSNSEQILSKNNSTISTKNSYSQALFELASENNLPPFERFISLILTSSNEKKLEKESFNLKEYLLGIINEKVLGPVEAPVYKIKRKYRQRILIRAKKTSKIQKHLRYILDKYKLPPGIKLTVDVDPISFN